MFEILDDIENSIVRVAFVGEIQPTDSEVSAPTFERIFETRKPLRIAGGLDPLLGLEPGIRVPSVPFSHSASR